MIQHLTLIQADDVLENPLFSNIRHRFFLGLALAIAPITGLMAGGGLVLEADACILRIDFYSAHFTAFQPDTRGNEQFCKSLPDTGPTIFVLDYLHQSLKEVPVDFRIIRDVTGLGRFVKLKHVQALEDIEQQTVYYQPPVIREDASLKVEYDFEEKGDYIIIVTAGHPTSDMTYAAIFPIEVARSGLNFLIIGLVLVALLAGILLARILRARAKLKPPRMTSGGSEA